MTSPASYSALLAENVRLRAELDLAIEARDIALEERDRVQELLDDLLDFAFRNEAFDLEAK